VSQSRGPGFKPYISHNLVFTISMKLRTLECNKLMIIIVKV
jgi:hypothetical protein